MMATFNSNPALIKDRVPTMLEQDLVRIFNSIPSNADYSTQMYWRLYGPY